MTDEQEQVVLISELDEVIGEAGKLDVHRTGQLHRAFSVVLLDDDGRVLLQQRAASKYHSPGLWSNTCCGHPRPGEQTVDAAQRRLHEEMGIACDLVPSFTFVYRSELGHDLVEHELDHVFVGRTALTPRPNRMEVDAWRWIGIDDLRSWMDLQPRDFTVWFPAVMGKLLKDSIR